MGERWKLNAKREDENAGFSNLEPGRYLLGIESVEDSLTQKNQYPMATLKCTALEGPSKGTLFHRVTCVPQGEKGHGFTLHFLHAVGLPYGGENAEDTVEIEFDSEEFIGRQFWADVDIEKYAKKDEDQSDKSTWTGEGSKATKIYTPEEIEAESGAGKTPEETTEQEPKETAEQIAEREAQEAADLEAAEAAAASAAAAAAKPKAGLKKPLVKPPLKTPAQTNGKVMPAKASFARR